MADLEPTQKTWQIGPLATATGLTVRTLHHYDHLGLVQPSARSGAGYRLYDESDVERLYRVLALRQLGLGLREIADVIDGQRPIGELLDQHRAQLDRQLVAIRTLRAQLNTVAAVADELGRAPVTDFLELIRRVITVNDTVKKYFSDEQLADLAERREQQGEQAVENVQAAWPDLITRVQRAVDAGTDPASSEAQQLAGEWMGLLEQFHGGDEGLRESLYRMQAENAEQIEQQHGGPSPALMEFVRAANAASPGR